MGKSLRTVCKSDSLPSVKTIFNWFRTNEGFLQQYTRAKEESADAHSDEMLDIADDGTNDWMDVWNPRTQEYDRVLDREHVERSKLRIDTRKWLVSKLKPKKYGDKLDLTNNGKDLPTPLLAGLATDLHALPAEETPMSDDEAIARAAGTEPSTPTLSRTSRSSSSSALPR
jgi:hypothetical protein